MFNLNRNLCFIMLLLMNFLSAQDDSNNRYTYKAEYFLDFKVNTHIDTRYKEYFTLYFNADESLFLSNKIIDLAMVDDSSTGELNLAALKKHGSVFKEIILNKNNQLTSYLEYDSRDYAYVEEKATWKLTNEEKKIGNLLCKKATTQLVGREWTAWYTLEYSVPFGSFKPNGLPGLIVELYDEGSTYHYSLVHIKKFKDEDVVNRVYPKSNAVLLSKEDCFKIYDDLLYNKKLLYGRHASFMNKLFTPERCV